MRIVKSPFRLSLFGGGTDYKSFYSQNESFLIGTTIDKYCYLTLRYRPQILSRESFISYSKLEIVKDSNDVENPLIREILLHGGISCCVEFHHFTDIPHRTGLGGSSSFAVGLLALIERLKGRPINKEQIAKQAIHIEREVLKEAGGIQDQIWAAYGGLNSIEIKKDGQFLVKPLPVTQNFKDALEDSFVLIYTDQQRQNDNSAKSYDAGEKKNIKEVAMQAYKAFLDEDIRLIGSLLYESWRHKRTISNHISTPKIDEIIKDVMGEGAYGVKLIGNGGCGFVAVMCDPFVKQRIIDKYKDSVLNIKFENDGVKEIYNA